MKIFEKKIYIGSVIGVIATIIGIVAIFFPSIFNLEKKKFVEFELVLKNKNDGDRLQNFLNERAEDKKLFKLNVSICNNSEDKKDKNEFNELTEMLNNDGEIIYGYPVRYSSTIEIPDVKTSYFPLIYPATTKQELLDGYVNVLDYYLIPVNTVVTYDSIRSGTDRVCEEGGIDIYGYYIFDKKEISRSYSADTIAISFDNIPEKDISLRDY